MVVKNSLSEYPRPVCIALGFFDCMHRGHAALVDAARKAAGEQNADVSILTFRGNPHAGQDKDAKLLFTFEERCDLFAAAGIRLVLAHEFDEAYRRTPPLAFLQSLTAYGNVRAVVCGEDFRFGKDRRGDTTFLREFCAGKGIDCLVVPAYKDADTRISSTQIRRILAQGDTKEAARRMGHAYFADGIVRHGRGVGQIYGYPTANLEIPSEKLLPCDGVYATIVSADGKRYRAVTNIGTKPTFDIYESTVETLLQSFGGDLYGKTLRVEFVYRLRDIRKFATPQALRVQIEQDITWKEEP